MPRKKPTPFPVLLERFHENKKPGQVIWCKRYYVQDLWDISAGAVIDLNLEPHPTLIKIAKALYKEDISWFQGDTRALKKYKTNKQIHENERK